MVWGMGPQSLEQVQSRADNLYCAGAVPLGASDGVQSFRAPPRAASRIAVQAQAKVHGAAMLAATYRIAIRDFHSPVQTAADRLVISVQASIAYLEMFLNMSRPIRRPYRVSKECGI